MADIPEARHARSMIARRVLVLALAVTLGASVKATAQDLPPVPSSLLNASAAVCIKVSADGSVTDAFVISSTGNAEADRDLLDWVRQLHWPAAEPRDTTRDKWFPMPVAFGDAQPPAAPATCQPPT